MRLKHWGFKITRKHNPVMIGHYPFFKDDIKYGVLPKDITIKKEYDRFIVNEGGEIYKDYKIFLKKEVVEVLPIKPSMTARYMGVSPLIPLYRPQKVEKYDDVVYNYLKSKSFRDNNINNRLEDEVPLRMCVNPGWASQQNEFQIFCNPTIEISTKEIISRTFKKFSRLKLPQMDGIEAIDTLLVGTNKDASPGIIPEALFGRQSKHKDLDAILKFIACGVLRKAKSERGYSSRLPWQVGGRTRQQKLTSGEALRSRFLIAPDGVEKICGLACIEEFQKELSIINKKFNNNEIQLGVDFMNGNFKHVFHNRIKKKRFAVELDLKRFDQHVGPNVIKVAFSILRSCYPNDVEYDNLFNYYCSSFINKNIIIPGGYIYRVKKSIATGSPFTSIIGNLSNWIIQTCVLDRMNVKDYDLMVYGDDTLILLDEKNNFCSATYEKYLFEMFTQTADPISIKRIDPYSSMLDQPTFLKTFSRGGLPGRKFSDTCEKLFFPERNPKNLFEWMTRTAQLLYSSPFNLESRFMIRSFYRFINRTIFEAGKGNKKFIKNKKTGKQMARFISISEFKYDSETHFQRLMDNVVKKYLPPINPRQSWTQYSFETYKMKFIEERIIIPKNVINNINIESLYSYNSYLTYLYLKNAIH
jgi:hypothetical protein